MIDPWEILDEAAFSALVWSEDQVDTDFLNLIPDILEASGIEPIR